MADSPCDSQENDMCRIMAVRSASDGVAFTIKADAGMEECYISREALDTLSRLKNIDSSDADALEIFHALESFIRPVAQSHIADEAKGAPLTITAEIIDFTYRGKAFVP